MQLMVFNTGSTILCLVSVLSVPLLQVGASNVSRVKLIIKHAALTHNSTTWVAEVIYASIPPGQPLPSPDTATRAGSLALLNYALVALATGSILPWLSTLGRRPLISSMKPSLRSRAIIKTLMLLTPRNFWTAGLVLYAIIMVGTFFVSTLEGAMFVVAALGIPWAINCWVSPNLVDTSFPLMRKCNRSPSLSSWSLF